MDLTGKEIVIRSLSVNNFAQTSVIDVEVMTETSEDGVFSADAYRITHSVAFDNMEDPALMAFVTSKLEAV